MSSIASLIRGIVIVRFLQSIPSYCKANHDILYEVTCMADQVSYKNGVSHIFLSTANNLQKVTRTKFFLCHDRSEWIIS